MATPLINICPNLRMFRFERRDQRKAHQRSGNACRTLVGFPLANLCDHVICELAHKDFSIISLDRVRGSIGKGIKAEYINDDALGRCLDQLYEAGVSDIYQMLSASVVQHLELPCEGINLDSTSIHVDGNYEHDHESKAVKLVRGYSRDHRPELNQVVLNLITENKAGIPVYMQAASGNINDNQGFKSIVKHHISSLKAAQDCQYFIADAALYTAESIQSLDEQKQLFI